jgi:hypothetical protein
MDKHTDLKGMVSRYKNPTMDKHINLKGMVSRYKNPTQWTGFLYLDTIPFKLVCLSIVGALYLDTIPFMLVCLSIVGVLYSRYKPPQWTNILT